MIKDDRLIDYMADLNEAQYEVVTSADGPILVIAGAGSGKTRTIVYRVAWLIEQGVYPENILLLTFTRRAAREMLQRAEALLSQSVGGTQGGTFHSIANLLLRRYSSFIGYDSSFSIMDQSDSIEAVDHIKKSLDSHIRDPKSMPKSRTIAAIISRSVNTSLDIGATLNAYYSQFSDNQMEIELIRSEYDLYKRDNNLMDYDDLLINLVRLLEDHEEVRRKISLDKRYVLVDEYQDTNQLQSRIVRLLAHAHDNVMVVGDDSQSIYSFRGATFENIIRFPQEFPGTKIVKLEENYRSTSAILNLTNEIISNADSGYPKKLFTKKTKGLKPLLHRPYSERDQSIFAVECVKELRSYGIQSSNVAILFRAGFDSFDLEGELTRNDISFVKYGGFKFLESQHIKDVLAHLKVIGNYQDRLSWTRCLKLIQGIGAKTALKIATKIGEMGDSANIEALAKPRAKYYGQLDELITLINHLRNHSGPISEKIDLINESYFSYLKDNFDNYPKRMMDLDKLSDLTLQYTDLNNFLNDMALDPPETDPGSTLSDDSLILSTIHSAKGLEWHTVILIWACEGKIPSHMSELKDELEEERRLVYVACTRAKHNLVILAPMTRMDRRMGVVGASVSRFFLEPHSNLFRSYNAHTRK